MVEKIGPIKNPLTVIAIFSGLAETSGTVVLPFIEKAIQPTFVWFLILFPILIVILFFVTLNFNYKVLYAPSDFQSDAAFLKIMSESQSARENLINIASNIGTNENDILEILSSKQFREKLSFTGVDKHNTDLKNTASKIAIQISKSNFITISFSEFASNIKDMILPVKALPTFSNLLNIIYFAIHDYVDEYTYGKTWILKDNITGKVFENLRMLKHIEYGGPYRDKRNLSEVGIEPGMVLNVVRV